MAFSSRRNKIMNLLKEPKMTNIEDLYSRPLNFNDFPVAFENHNEYENSLRYLETYNLLSLKCLTENDEKSLQKIDFLLCNEVLTNSETDISDNEQSKEQHNIDIFHDSDDSRDKDYVPDSLENSSEDESMLTKSPYKSEEQLKNKYLYGKKVNTSPQEENTIECTNKSMQSQVEEIQILQEIDEQPNNEDIPMLSHQEVKKVSSQDSDKSTKGLTKDGKPRQRRKFEESLKDRQHKKKKENEEKLFMKEPCNSSCKKQCITKITHEQRQEIHDKYINLNWEAQGIFIKCFVEESPVSRRTQSQNTAIKRTVTYKYFFKPQNEKIEVCKTFFLCTLGYHRTNDSRIVTALKKPLECQKINRGRYERTNKIDKENIKNHILTYNPCISHYRREHAPNRLYLPSDITVTMMHEQYCNLYPEKKVSLEYYRQVVKNDMNISFAHLGHEECEQCAEFQKHDAGHVNNIRIDICKTCKSYMIHKERYKETRKSYKNDVELALTDKEHIYYSVDLQKVIMLPRMEQYKSAIFCTRIVAYNESFVPLGTTSEHVPLAVLWNETISGRNQEDIVSTFRAFLLYKRDAKHITLWLDNCAAQNKNWALFSFLVDMVNSTLIAAKTITLKYLDSGHTFMSADSFHHQVEKALKKMDKVYDFHDFVECVRLSNSKKNYVKVMEISDFYFYQDLSSQHKLRKKEPRVYLKDMALITVERGHYTLKYKTSHNCNNYYLTLDFLQTKIMKAQFFSETLPKTQEKGIAVERKTEILTKLTPLMPENRREYWRNLPESTST